MLFKAVAERAARVDREKWIHSSPAWPEFHRTRATDAQTPDPQNVGASSVESKLCPRIER